MWKTGSFAQLKEILKNHTDIKINSEAHKERGKRSFNQAKKESKS